MLVIYGPLWFTIFLDGNDHRASPISGQYWIYDTPFRVFPKSLPYWFFKVKRHKNWVISGFGDYSLFEVDMGGNLHCL